MDQNLVPSGSKDPAPQFDPGADLNTSFHPQRPEPDPAKPWNFIAGALAALSGLVASGAGAAADLDRPLHNAPVANRLIAKQDELSNPSPETRREVEQLILTSFDPNAGSWRRERAERDLAEMDPGGQRLLKIAWRASENLGQDAPDWQRDAYRRFLMTRQLNIEFTNRIPDNRIDEIISNRLNQYPDGRPLALVIYPKGDHNGAFYTATSEFEELMAAGYRVVYFEVESDTQLIEAAFTGTMLGTQAEQRADIPVVGGHGNRDLLMLERHSGESLPDSHGYVDFGDEQRFKDIGLGRVLAPGGQIILDSCSNGEGRAERDNMANFFRRVFPHAREQGIWSATESYSIEHFTFDENGVLQGVNFHVPEYRAFMEGSTPRPDSVAADIRV